MSFEKSGLNLFKKSYEKIPLPPEIQEIETLIKQIRGAVHDIGNIITGLYGISSLSILRERIKSTNSNERSNSFIVFSAIEDLSGEISEKIKYLQTKTPSSPEKNEDENKYKEEVNTYKCNAVLVGDSVRTKLGKILKILENLEEEEKNDIREYGLTDQIHSAIQTCEIMIDPQKNYKKTNFDINELLKDTSFINSLKSIFGKQIQLTTDIQEGQAIIHANENQIKRVILNLVQNAREAMPKGGKFKIESRYRIKNSIKYICLSFIDTGEGIDPDIINLIFEEGVTTKSEAGHGLGLNIIRKIIKDDHNGEIIVSSSPNRGTAFDLYIPLPPPPCQVFKKPKQK